MFYDAIIVCIIITQVKYCILIPLNISDAASLNFRRSYVSGHLAKFARYILDNQPRCKAFK